MVKSALKDAPQAIQDQNFLLENPDFPLEKVVVVAREIPKMETIIFMNNRDPGITLHFHYASKTHKLKHYDLVHGQQYSLPVEVIQHLEGQHDHDPYACHKRLYGRRMKDDGITENYVNGYTSYFHCKPVRKAA
jgi:hypothetical protein